MARTVPNKGYGGIYGEEAAGKAPGDVRASRAQKAANDFAGAEEAASRETPRNEDNTTSSSTDVAENGSAGHTPQYSGDSGTSASKAGKATAGGALAKTTPMGRIAGGLKNVFSSGDGGGNRKPLFAIGGLTGILALLMLTISSALPLHITEIFGELKNSLQTINFERGNVLIRRTSRQSADPNNLFSKRNGVNARRAAQINKGFEGTGLRFVAENGKYVLRSDDGSTIANEAELKSRFDSDADFRKRWNTGADIITGRSGGWFNGATELMIKSNRLTRNLFKDRIAAQDANDAMQKAQDKIKTQTDILSQDISSTSKQVVDGEEEEDTRVNTQRMNELEIGEMIHAKALSMAGGLERASGGLGGLAIPCAAMMAVSAVSLVYAAAEAA